MGIIYHTNKKSGVTYAYENKSYWDKEKRQSRAKRKPIGKVDPITGEIIPTREYTKKAANNNLSGPGTVPEMRYRRSFYGATYLLDQIGRLIGVEADLKVCFPDTYKQILSLVYYLIMEDKNPLFRFEKWGAIHKHLYGDDIPSQRSSELFMSITMEAQMGFFRRQGNARTVII